jgi:hypothetical protein
MYTGRTVCVPDDDFRPGIRDVRIGHLDLESKPGLSVVPHPSALDT